MIKNYNDLFSNKWFVFFSLATLIFICYSPALKNGFTNWDDQEYVLRNTAIRSFTAGSIVYLFSHFILISYHPITLLSLQLNYLLSGTAPFSYIFTNILFHILNCYLLFVFLCVINLQKRFAYFVALLFAIQPLNVESVAWIAERKDVLFVFFFLLSLISYVRYYKKGEKKFYFIAILFFLLSCMSKAQAITLSLTLFLVDYLLSGKFNLKESRNKIPFLIISCVFGFLNILAQGENASAFTGSGFTFLQRLSFAGHNYIHYIVHPMIPVKLSAFYSYPNSFDKQYFIFPLIAAFIVILTIYYFRKNRLVIFSVLFFTFNIFFLLQLFPVGDAMRADRYSYLSSVGLFIILVYAAERLIAQSKINKYILASVAFFYFIFLAQSTFARCSVWKNGITLWTDVIKKYPETTIAYVNRGANFYEKGDTSSAINDFTKALSLDSTNSFALFNAATIYYNNGDFEKCSAILQNIDSVKAANTDAFLLKAYSENKLKNYSSSLRNTEIFLSRKKTAEGYTLAGLNNIQTGNYFQAKKQLDIAIETDSAFAEAFVKRGVLFMMTKDSLAACNDWKKAASLGNKEVESFIKSYCGQ